MQSNWVGAVPTCGPLNSSKKVLYLLSVKLQSDRSLRVVKGVWVGEIPRASYVSTETIAHDTNSCDCG